MSDEELLASIVTLRKKIKRLENLGPGAGMATAGNSAYLREYIAEAKARGLEVPG